MKDQQQTETSITPLRVHEVPVAMDCRSLQLRPGPQNRLFLQAR
jgi:hypothetical protein